MGKFGEYANTVSAVWFWNKLKLRGGSRGKQGEELLAYIQGGFIRIVEELEIQIKKMGGEIIKKTKIDSIKKNASGWKSHATTGKVFCSDSILVTTSLPIYVNLINKWANFDYINKISKIKYLGNVCLVIETNKSLSDCYWINVNDTNFPFVAIIEHTNFHSSEYYSGNHILYLSKYLPVKNKLFAMNAKEMFEYAAPYLKKMFPNFSLDSVVSYHLWKANFSQPIVNKNYSNFIPSPIGPKKGLYLCTMAQIYPEDRGTNYAVREAKKISKIIIKSFNSNE